MHQEWLVAVKKAYYRQSMKWHPDRFSDSESNEAAAATVKFQVGEICSYDYPCQILVRAYSILGDKEKRAVYDETGVLDEEGAVDGGEGFDETLRLWRKVFKKITVEEIENYMKTYKGFSSQSCIPAGSELEKDDVVASYKRRNGDLELISQEIIGYDEDETVKLISHLIEV